MQLKKRFAPIALILFLILPTHSSAVSRTYSIVPNASEISINIQVLGFSSLSGQFQVISGKIITDIDDWRRNYVQIEIDANSVDTSQQYINEQIKSASFLDTKRYPRITFIGRQFRWNKHNKLQITGPLTLHGITKDITLMAELAPEPAGPRQELIFSGYTILKRSDFGINTAIPILDNEIKLTFKVQAFETFLSPPDSPYSGPP